MKKKLLSLALALCMALALLPGAAFAADSGFTIVDGVLTKYNGGGGDVVIPDGVTSIGASAFERCAGLTTVAIPDSVTSIGASAFENCIGLTSVAIPDGVTDISGYAFARCTSLTSITIPNGITSLRSNTFFGCENLTNVTIPDSVTSIGNAVFQGCTSLTSITIPNSVTSIGERTFSGTGLTSVTIPDGITNIDYYTFGFCSNLTNVAIPSSVTSIEYYAFGDCPNLTDVYYTGSEVQWKSIDIDESENKNDDLLSAAIHYNSSGPAAVEPDPVEPPVPTVGGFNDVYETDYFAAPVLWAVENNITSGTGNGGFSPNATCTRAQVVTFLHRAVGAPSASASNPFTDVNTDDYYGPAVLWAYENNVTKGSGGGFSPDGSCTRGEVVAFLWRAKGSPEPSTASTSFTDVQEDGYYYQAMLWAVENGITSGTGNGSTFSPNDVCTRAQVAAFLYRAFAD